MTAGMASPRLEERIADARQSSVADADAVVLDRDDKPRALGSRGHRHVPARSVNLIALDRRLSSTCLTARLSASDLGRSPGTETASVRPASRARNASNSQQFLITGSGANGSGVISKSPVSIFDMSRMPFTTDSR